MREDDPGQAAPQTLPTTAGDLPLEEYRLALAGRTWNILHTGAILSHEDEDRFLRGDQPRLPYGIALWPAAIALAHDLAERPLQRLNVLELGAGTGLPGIVAASLGARVIQTDKNAAALVVARRNAERNAVTLEQRNADWTDWHETATFDLIIGADILYADSLHAQLRHIFETNLVPGGAPADRRSTTPRQLRAAGKHGGERRGGDVQQVDRGGRATATADRGVRAEAPLSA